MELIIVLLIIGLLYLFRRNIQVWLLQKLLQRVQKRMSQGMGNQSQQGYNANRERRQPSQEGYAQSDYDNHPHGKVDVTKVDARKFSNTDKSGEYVDFEEVK